MKERRSSPGSLRFLRTGLPADSTAIIRRTLIRMGISFRGPGEWVKAKSRKTWEKEETSIVYIYHFRSEHNIYGFITHGASNAEFVRNGIVALLIRGPGEAGRRDVHALFNALLGSWMTGKNHAEVSRCRVSLVVFSLSVYGKRQAGAKSATCDFLRRGYVISRGLVPLDASVFGGVRCHTRCIPSLSQDGGGFCTPNCSRVVL